MWKLFELESPQSKLVCKRASSRLLESLVRVGSLSGFPRCYCTVTLLLTGSSLAWACAASVRASERALSSDPGPPGAPHVRPEPQAGAGEPLLRTFDPVRRAGLTTEGTDVPRAAILTQPNDRASGPVAR